MDSNFSHNIKKKLLLCNLRIWDPLIHLHTPRCHNTYGCVRLEPEASSGDLPHGPSFVAFPGHWQGADQKQNSQNINKCLCGMLASQVAPFLYPWPQPYSWHVIIAYVCWNFFLDTVPNSIGWLFSTIALSGDGIKRHKQHCPALAHRAAYAGVCQVQKQNKALFCIISGLPGDPQKVI